MADTLIRSHGQVQTVNRIFSALILVGASGSRYQTIPRYAFDLLRGQIIISFHQAQGGPELIYDHQMVIDSERQFLYVFGGRIISNSSPTGLENTYSGLYSYSIAQGKWTLLRYVFRVDCGTDSFVTGLIMRRQSEEVSCGLGLAIPCYTIMHPINCTFLPVSATRTI